MKEDLKSLTTITTTFTTDEFISTTIPWDINGTLYGENDTDSNETTSTSFITTTSYETDYVFLNVTEIPSTENARSEKFAWYDTFTWRSTSLVEGEHHAVCVSLTGESFAN